jgi:hypothetical protein
MAAAPSKQKPPVPKLEQEAKKFIEESAAKSVPPDPVRSSMAAVILAGLIARGAGLGRAEELVEEAYRLADLVLKTNN